jgi:lipopolysaccharide transport system ATP-binding protein
MGNIALRVRNLSKQYKIGSVHHDTLRDHLSHIMRKVIFPNRRGQAATGEDKIWALKDVSFDVRVGEVVGVIGGNGAGKSTLLKILSRITEPTAGYIQTKSRIGALLEVGTGFHPELTGRENIYLNGAILGMKKHDIKRKFDEIVAFAEMEKFLDTPVKRYSSGMYVRLAFAVAVHLEPEILVVDEVLSVGDANFQKRCIGKMESIADEGRTVLFVSHNLRAVQTLCGRGILLQEGRLVDQGPVDDIIQAYSRESNAREAERTTRAENRPGHYGKRLRITRIEFFSAHDGSSLSSVSSGQDVLIRIGYDCLSNDPIDDVSFGIGFFTPERVRLFNCRSHIVGTVYRVRPGKGSVICRLRKWPLSGGIYTYNVHAGQGNAVFDLIPDAGTVRVESGDYYGTGKVVLTEGPCVFVGYEWDLQEINGRDRAATELEA